MSNNIIQHWPIESPPRDIQTSILEWLEKNTDKKYLIVQAPVGSGKSLLGVTLSRYLTAPNGHSYILTPQKILQSQYEDTFPEPWLGSLYGKVNYPCMMAGNCEAGVSCSPNNKPCNGCTWLSTRDNCKNTQNVVLNYKLALMYFGIPDEDKVFTKRKLIVCDEAHQLEQQLIDYDSVQITREQTIAFKLKWPDIPNTDEALTVIVNWIADEYLPLISAKVSTLEQRVEMIKVNKAGGSNLSKSEQVTLREFSKMNEHLISLMSITSIPSEQLHSERVAVHNSTDITIKRLTAQYSFNNLLNPMCDQLLFMSSTILDADAFCEDLGIEPSEMAYIDMPSEFPIENRPVYYNPTIRMNAQWNTPINTEGRKYLQQVAETIINKLHKDDSGIIHTGNFKIAEWLVSDLAVNHTVFHHIPGVSSCTREQAINDYIDSASSGNPSLLISPSITEGLDLMDNKGRFAIFAKIPYPHLGDQWVKRRMAMSNSWYQRQALIGVIQGCGRIVRSKHDVGCVYILDMLWSALYSNTYHSIPQWWKDAYKSL